MYVKEYDVVTEITKYGNVKTRQGKKRRKILGYEQNSEDSEKTVISARSFTAHK